MIRRHILFVFLCAIVGAVVILSACSPNQEVLEVEVTRYQVLEVPIVETRLIEVTREVEVVKEVEVEVTREVEVLLDPTPVSPPGSAENPFQIIFIPSFPKTLIEVRGAFLVNDLEEQTGFKFEIIVPEEDENLSALVCSRPDTAIAMLTPAQYVEVKEICDIFPAVAATKFGSPYQLAMLVSRTSSVINVFEDISFKTVGIPSLDDLPTYQVLVKDIEDGGLPGVELIEYGTSTSSLIALLEKEIDIAAAIYNPPSMPADEDAWIYGEDAPEIWKQLASPPRRNPIGFVEVAGGPAVGGYRVRDARASIFDDYPDVFSETKILLLSDPYPNDMIALGQSFPISAFNQVLNGLINHSNSDSCRQSMCASDFYQWDGVQTVNDDFFDIVRELNSDD